MTVPARISLVTLGVADVARSTQFYLALGWPMSSSSVPGEVSFFRTVGGILALYGRNDLAADATVEVGSGQTPSFRGVALAINLEDPTQVDAALDAATAAGGRLVKPAQPTEWGGYSGYFADPDGHLWEVAHNPGWPLDATGLPILP